MADKLTVVLSQSQSKHPARRGLEENIATYLLMEKDIEVSVIPNLYDIDEKHTAMLFLRSIGGDMVVLSWLYPRAAHWMLDRSEVKGHMGEVLLLDEEDEDEVDDAEETNNGIGAADIPDRHIYTVDMRVSDRHEDYVEEIRRIAKECKGRNQAKKVASQLGFVSIDSVLPTNGALKVGQEELMAPTRRRWYPVIDFGRCTNCMECIDFCLFGVYGVDSMDRILVENPDNCKKGCPACSRVCPEQAIIFPEYKSPEIAGANVGGIGGLKIDLTKLFGGGDAISIAASERDTELIRDGREAVGLAVGIPRRQEGLEAEPRDELDALMDSLEDVEI
ncbi:MAG: ferredoxin family protein [Planctomycetota bacterium]|nr:ferredoxin family protein [Planctomycetota bacterium]